MSKIIEITVAPDGATKVETKGFIGYECLEASRLIEIVLGTRTSEILKSEFHQAGAIDHSLKSKH